MLYLTSINYIKLLGIICLFTTCANSQSVEEDDVPSDEDNFAMRAVVQGNSKFAKYLYFLLKDINQSKNFVFSPYSISMLLGMLRSGASSNRKTEFQEALQMRALSDSLMTEGFSELIQNFPENDDIVYKSLERIYVPLTHKIRLKFKESVQDDFYSETGVRSMDFGKSVTAAEKINTWVSQKTKGKLKSIISPDSISKDSKLVLVSGVYFRGSWENSFQIQNLENGTLDFFHFNTTHASNVTMMNSHGQFKYVNLPEMRSEAVAIPFAGERLELVVLLPKNRDGLKFPLEEKIKEVNSSFTSIISQMKLRNVKLFLPKFDTESFWTFSHSDQNSMLEKLGLNVVSSERGLLDYNGITAYPGLFLDKIIHKTIISITEAGANPPLEPPEEGEEPIVVLADHPFIFFIYDTETKSILLLSRKAF